MSLLALLKKKVRINSFTTPSHSQCCFVFHKLRNFYKYDISETDAHNPQDALKFTQEKASKIYMEKNDESRSNYFASEGNKIRMRIKAEE